MKTIAKLGLAAVLVLGGTSAFAQDAAVDTSTTGSVGTYGSVITLLQSETSVDLTAFNESSTVNCVKASMLQGSPEADAQALDSAITEAGDKLATLRGGISGNAAFMDKVKASCAMPDLDPNKIVAVESGTGGQFTVYIDDRA
jgi:hypothetical protein